MDKEIVIKSMGASWILTGCVYASGECMREGIWYIGTAIVQYLIGSVVGLLVLIVAAIISSYLESVMKSEGDA